MRITLTAVIILLTVALDQITKWFALAHFHDGPVAVFPFFNLVLVYNKGVSFGMFQNIPSPMILAALSLCIVFMLLVWLYKTDRKDLTIALSLVIGGAIGNIIDRFAHGAVIDFLDFHYKGWHYPAFNIADSCIVLGIAFLLLDGLFFEQKRNNVEHEKTDDDAKI